jgi:hypothetical protein
MGAQRLPHRTGKTEGEPQRRREHPLYPRLVSPCCGGVVDRLGGTSLDASHHCPNIQRYTETRALLLHGATRAASE